MRQSSAISAALLAAALAACQQSTETDANIAVDNQAGATATGADGSIETLPPSEEPSAPNDIAVGNGSGNEAEDDSENSPSTAVIPAQYRGRWGLVPADCTTTRGDNKGLMTVGEQSLRFYESVAALQEQRPAIATSFSGVYVFTGEGQTWERVITLTRTGDKLKRAQADGNFTYTRCR